MKLNCSFGVAMSKSKFGDMMAAEFHEKKHPPSSAESTRVYIIFTHF